MLQEDPEAVHVRRAVGDEWKQDQAAPRDPTTTRSVGMEDCILLFGAFCNGNMGDVVQPISMEHLLASVAPTGQCFYYAHPRAENPSKGFKIGKFYGGDESKLMGLSSDAAWEVNRFKVFVIGGGGIFSAKHAPLFMDMFAEAVNVPIAVMGVGANHRTKEFGTLLQKAAFVSGRDTPSIDTLAGVLSKAATPAVRPDDVRLVRDPVLCDRVLSDTTGACWRQSEGDQQQAVCFVLPAAKNPDTIEMHQRLRANVVRRGDRFINVFPKHQEELAQFGYPGIVEEILDPMEYVEQLCSCKAIVSARFHGAILGLHMGVPTFGAFHVASENKVPDLMIDTMSLPDQFFLVDEHLTREVVDRQVDTVRRLYADEGRRVAIHDKLSVFYEEFQVQARHMMSDVVGVALQQQQQPQQQQLTPPPRQQQQQQQQQQERFGANNAADIGNECLFAAFLLFTIAGLASVSPTAGGGGGRGSRQRPCKTPAADGDRILPSTTGKGKKADQYRAQAEVEACTGTSAERGSPPERSAATTPEPSPTRPLLGGRGVPSTAEPSSTTLFAVNFALWVALAVNFSTYSKSYLRDTRDPIGLLALQGVSGSVVLFFLRRLGLEASDARSPDDAPSKTRGVEDLQVQPMTAGRQESLVAVLHSGQAILTNFSLFVGGVAVTNALKAMEPVVAAVASYLLLGKRVAPGGIVSFAIIVAGILALTFQGTGGGGRPDTGEEAADTGAADAGGGHILVAAGFTTAAVSCNALRNVVIKKGDPVPPRRTLFTCSVAAGTIGMTLMLLRLVFRRMDDLLLGGEDRLTEGGEGAYQYGSWLSMSGINAALCFVGYNFASFNLLAHLSPVGHAVGNSVKRVVMFGSGIILMGEVITARQLAGAAVALVGVGVYNVASKRN